MNNLTFAGILSPCEFGVGHPFLCINCISTGKEILGNSSTGTFGMPKVCILRFQYPQSHKKWFLVSSSLPQVGQIEELAIPTRLMWPFRMLCPVVTCVRRRNEFRLMFKQYRRNIADDSGTTCLLYLQSDRHCHREEWWILTQPVKAVSISCSAIGMDGGGPTNGTCAASFANSSTRSFPEYSLWAGIQCRDTGRLSESSVSELKHSLISCVTSNTLSRDWKALRLST